MGTGLIWVPIVIVLFSMGNYWQGLVVLIGTIVIMSNIDNVIRFIVFKRFADVHPVVTILGVLFGLSVFGLPGLVFGPLLISYFLLLVGMFMAEYSKKNPTDELAVAGSNAGADPDYSGIPVREQPADEVPYISNNADQDITIIPKEKDDNSHSPE